ncbi:uncharacterized protein TA03070 [Theileria annulata]|uniref:Uncharacterized protein n=1 Tax=Theileria annulata TaxID=5874 RepID=Q4UHG1_THEAN|nr:uncharacterized protein TA03070 [Theileria annulata]CAI73478.1 hypothetical protein, conserved [Theileria annulata]|eukprot:XP_954155.1 hypothetical protein, conserved [Theileria annulata]
MDLRCLCNCDACNSVLVNFGHVIILCDIPISLLLSYNSELIYSKFNCDAINIILITNVKSFLGLNLLNEFFNLSSTHVITTSPIYSISSLLNNTTNTNNNLTGFINVNTSTRVKKLINNVKEKNFNPQYKLHIISFNQFLTLITTINTTNAGTSTDSSDAIDMDSEDMAVEMEIVGYSNGYNFGGCNYMLRHVSKVIFTSLLILIFLNTLTPMISYCSLILFILQINNNYAKNLYIYLYINKAVEDSVVENKVVELVDKIMSGNIILMMDILDDCLIEILLELCSRIDSMQQQHRYVYCVGTGVEELFDFYNKSCEWVNESRAENTMDPNDPNSPFPEITNLIQNNILLIANHMKDIVNVFKSPSITFLFHPYSYPVSDIPNMHNNVETANGLQISNINKVYVINKNTNSMECIKIVRENDLNQIIQEFENRKGKIINLDEITLQENFTLEENFNNFGLTKLRIPITNHIKFKQINPNISVTKCKMTDGVLMGCDEGFEIPFGNVRVEKVLEELKRVYNEILPEEQMNKELLIKGKNFELTVDELRNEILITTTNPNDLKTLNKVILNLFKHYSYVYIIN